MVFVLLAPAFRVSLPFVPDFFGGDFLAAELFVAAFRVTAFFDTSAVPGDFLAAAFLAADAPGADFFEAVSLGGDFLARLPPADDRAAFVDDAFFDLLAIAFASVLSARS